MKNFSWNQEIRKYNLTGKFVINSDEYHSDLSENLES